ncbi:stress-activated map kinase interacting protein 1-domain-containing protein [Lipomyces tetrasporus]|uniref:Stress-activated map kinase interacting protein 1-domain-containing protein n=1 Tax=Lipomyces tetrasporus TaxID=54092 RepID=A0AAD7QVN0_9ASCO|nr:stress-activated map kinase interacting protein 1-domain-containing protein [Lipomyces tetrasporus]KAJ8102031.1 stress-activated map kinase interacting protein 1-domain-containing protein [Lipomyces tetrasporus]
MSLLHDRSFILYNLRRSYLDRIQDGVGERVIHIDKDLYSRAWAVDSTSRVGPAIADPPPQFNPEFEYSPPIPNFVESDRMHSTSTPDTPAFYARGTVLSFGELANAIDGVRRGMHKKIRGDALPDERSESDFDDDESEFESDDEEHNDRGDNEDNDRDRHKPTDYHPSQVDSFGQMNDDENDEMEIEELQRAARQIKFSKMPARAKDLIPDVDQMLSTYIQTNNRNHHHTRQQSGKTSDTESNWQGEESDTVNIGLAGNSESKGIAFLQSSSFRRTAAFDRRWGDISMDENVLQGERVNETDAISGTATPVLPQPFSADLGKKDVVGIAPSNESPLESTSSRDLARISVRVRDVSNLTALIQLSQDSAKNPFEIYTSASGVGELKPLHLKLYRPTSSSPSLPFEVVVKPYVTVADTIGYALYRYWEEKRTPELTEDECDVKSWTLRIVEEDGEPDRDFPALDRTRIISAFSFDEFALVEATPSQVKENQKVTALRQ